MGLHSGLKKRLWTLYLKNTALVMPDGRFSIINEMPFFNLSLQIRVHPILHFRRRCSFRARSHANRLKKNTNFPLLGGLFEPIFEWMGANQVIDKNDAHNRPFCTSTWLQQMYQSSWIHTIHFYIPHQASSYILVIHSIYNSKRLSGESIRCWFRFVARISRPWSHAPCDRVQDGYEEQEFWMTRLDLVGVRLNQFDIFGEHENCLSRWKQCCSRWKHCWMKTMYK